LTTLEIDMQTLEDMSEIAAYQLIHLGRASAIAKALHLPIEQAKEKLNGLLSVRREDLVVEPGTYLFTDSTN